MSEIVTDSYYFPDLKYLHGGKVRDMYGIPGHDDKLLMVASDRISAYDVIMDKGIPGKGEILTELSLFWFKYLGDIVENHLITADVDQYPEVCRPYAKKLKGRSMLVKKTTPLPIECIVRGYISGSFWSAYQKAKIQVCCKTPHRKVLGIKLPAYMLESEGFSEPFFTPSTKAELGEHDENISVEQMGKIVGVEKAQQISDICLRLYKKAANYAIEKGIIIADTKFELGELDGRLILIDEVLTPDSSRFWPADRHVPGKSQPSFDKQYLRNYLANLDWDKNPPPPKLPPRVVEKTGDCYKEARQLLLAT